MLATVMSAEAKSQEAECECDGPFREKIMVDTWSDEVQQTHGKPKWVTTEQPNESRIRAELSE